MRYRWLTLLPAPAAPVLVAASVSAAAPVAEDSVDLAGITRLTVDGWTCSQVDSLLPYGFDFLADKALEPQRTSGGRTSSGRRSLPLQKRAKLRHCSRFSNLT